MRLILAWIWMLEDGSLLEISVFRSDQSHKDRSSQLESLCLDRFNELVTAIFGRSLKWLAITRLKIERRISDGDLKLNFSNKFQLKRVYLNGYLSKIVLVTREIWFFH